MQTILRVGGRLHDGNVSKQPAGSREMRASRWRGAASQSIWGDSSSGMNLFRHPSKLPWGSLGYSLAVCLVPSTGEY